MPSGDDHPRAITGAPASRVYSFCDKSTKSRATVNICILGNAGAGKSTAAEIISQFLGAAVHESDAFAHQAYAPGTAGWLALIKHFGRHILCPDESIDRRLLRATILSSPRAKEILKSVVDPFVRTRVHDIFVVQPRAPHEHLILASYLLIERQWHLSAFDRAIVINCNTETCVARLVNRHWTQQEARTLLDQQLAPETVLAEAMQLFRSRVTVINNEGTLQTFKSVLQAATDSLVLSSAREPRP